MPYVLSDETAGKLANVLGHAPPLAGAVPPTAYDAPVMVKVTSFSSGSGAGTMVEWVSGAWATVSGSSTVTVRAPNSETLAVNSVYRCTFHGYDSTNSRAIYITSGGQGGGAGSVVSITANADNAGTAWTQGTITGVGGGEVVDIQPRYGAGVTVGSLTYAAHKVWANLEYLGRDTGNVSSGTNRRRFYVWPIGLVACDSSVTPNVLRTI